MMKNSWWPCRWKNFQESYGIVWGIFYWRKWSIPCSVKLSDWIADTNTALVKAANWGSTRIFVIMMQMAWLRFKGYASSFSEGVWSPIAYFAQSRVLQFLHLFWHRMIQNCLIFIICMLRKPCKEFLIKNELKNPRRNSKFLTLKMFRWSERSESKFGIENSVSQC